MLLYLYLYAHKVWMSTLCLAFVKTGEDGHAEVGLNAFKKAFSLFLEGLYASVHKLLGACVCVRVWVAVAVITVTKHSDRTLAIWRKMTVWITREEDEGRKDEVVREERRRRSDGKTDRGAGWHSGRWVGK